MAKKYKIMIAVFVTISLSAEAQGIKQWFSQKSTQTEYLVQQIAALKMYARYLKSGYNLVDGGLRTIHDIKNGHFNLDWIFVDSLKIVRTAVKNNGRIPEIIALQKETTRLMNASLKMVQQSQWYHGSDRTYIQKVFSGVRRSVRECTTALEDLLRDGLYQMTDDERLQRIEGLYLEVRRQNTFVQAFSTELKKLQWQRQQELKVAETVKKIQNRDH